jgi:pimeloyl-ACP methyl ester carboxylesterase
MAAVSSAAWQIEFPDRIGALVYLDAFVLENGQSLHDTLPPPMRDAQLEQALHSGDGWKVPPIPAEAFHVNAQDLDRVNRQCTMQPLATFQQPLHQTGGIAKIQNVTFILATGWAASPFPPFYDQAKSKGWKTATMECGHDVMLDLPEELTRELVAASAHSASAD